MKKYAADNLMFLREHYPEIYNLVRNRQMDSSKYRREQARNGRDNLVILDSEREYSLYSKYDPDVEVSRWVSSLDASIARSHDVLLAGFGFGYHATALLEMYPDKRLYIYEPSVDTLVAAIESTDLRPILEDKRIAMFAVGDEDAVLVNLLIGMCKALKGLFSFATLPVYRKQYPDLEQRLATMIPQIARSYAMDMNTISHFNKEWIENLLLNMERNLRTPSFYPLQNIGIDLPAVIVGSGPSLGMEVERLRRLKDHAIIIAAGSSIQALLHHGIEPHVVISMDPGAANRRVFERIDLSNIPFLYIPTIKHNAILNDHSPYLMHGFFDMDAISHYLLELKPEDGVFASTSSVTGTAIQFAVHLGCSEIVFIGQDFSYPGNRVYSDGVGHALPGWEEKKISSSSVYTPNVNGGTNLSNPSMLNLKSDVEAVLEAFPGVKFYNASPVGAEIKHTDLKSLEQLLASSTDCVTGSEWFKQRMKERLSPISAERRGRVIQKLHDAESSIQGLMNLLDELDNHMRNNPKPTQAWFISFERMWGEILKHPIYDKILSIFASRELYHAERHWSEMSQESNYRKKLEKLQYCATPLLDELRKLVPVTKDTLKLLNERLEAPEHIPTVS